MIYHLIKSEKQALPRRMLRALCSLMSLSDHPESKPQSSPLAEQQPLSERFTQELSSLRIDILDNNLSTVIRDDKKLGSAELKRNV